MRDKDVPWTEGQIALLRKLWLTTTMSASAIGQEKAMGNRTRNSILGKVTRLGLHNRRIQKTHKTALYTPLKPGKLIMDKRGSV